MHVVIQRDLNHKFRTTGSIDTAIAFESLLDRLRLDYFVILVNIRRENQTNGKLGDYSHECTVSKQ